MSRRIDRDTYYMQIACLASLRGTCNRARVGCVIVSPDSTMVTGYNSSHPNTPHCEDSSCLMHEGHCIRCRHAEESAASKLKGYQTGRKAYVTYEPCHNCYKTLCAVGVEEIFFLKPYWDKPDAYKILIQEIGIKPQQLMNGECTIHQKF